MKNAKQVISIDAETNGLWGKPFAIAAIVYDEKGIELDKICLRLPNSEVTNEWVIKHVVPTLDYDITNNDLTSMLADFAVFYLKYKDSSTTLWHMGHVVESGLFRMLVEGGFIGEWDAPYVPIEVATALEGVGYEKPDSVDSYIAENNINIQKYGSTHNPLYDCEVAAKVYFHLFNN